MNNDEIKIKYLIGSFREDLNYPSKEDFDFLIKNWYYNEGGRNFIHDNRGVEETEKPCFTNNILVEKLNGNEKIANDLLDSLLEKNFIKVIKETRFTTYYTFI